MEVAPAAARFAQYLGAVALFGAPLFFLYALEGREARLFAHRVWPRPQFAAAALLMLIGGLVALGLETANMTGQPGDAYKLDVVLTVARDTQFGHGMTVRLALGAVMLPVCLLAPSRGQWCLFALVGAAALASFAWTGHGAADEGMGGAVHLWADIVHLLAAGVWLGALAALAALMIGQRAANETEALYRALKGFSGVGTAVVALLILTGVINGWFLVGPTHLRALPTTVYGQLLLAKLALFGFMLALAAHNRFTLTPRLGEGAAALPALRRSVGIEALAGLGVLALVGLLGVLPPASMG